MRAFYPLLFCLHASDSLPAIMNENASAPDINIIMPLLTAEARRLKVPVVGVIAQETNDPFQVLISCLLSLRTRDETTFAASKRLFKLANEPSSMMKLRTETIESAIYPVSFYRNKTAQILKICQRLLTVYEGKVPDTIDQLLTLSGVGRKTANLVVSVAYHLPAICVDTHVHRISNRFGLIKTSAADESEQVLRKKLPKTYWIHYNDVLVPFGQFVCTPISPFCSRCVIQHLCPQRGVIKKR